MSYLKTMNLQRANTIKKEEPKDELDDLLDDIGIEKSKSIPAQTQSQYDTSSIMRTNTM